MKYAQHFRVEKKQFESSGGDLVMKDLFYCHSVVEFLKEVDIDRGKLGVKQVTVIQGDSGQSYTKISVSRVDVADLEESKLTRIQGAGLAFKEELEDVHEVIKSRKRRRSREESIGGVDQFEDWGARKLLLLAIGHKVPETAYNLNMIFDALNLHGLAKYDPCNEIQIPGYLVDLFRLLGRPRKDFQLGLISYKMLWK